jgi:hypothetical protein
MRPRGQRSIRLKERRRALAPRARVRRRQRRAAAATALVVRALRDEASLALQPDGPAPPPFLRAPPHSGKRGR